MHRIQHECVSSGTECAKNSVGGGNHRMISGGEDPEGDQGHRIISVAQMPTSLSPVSAQSPHLREMLISEQRNCHRSLSQEFCTKSLLLVFSLGLFFFFNPPLWFFPSCLPELASFLFLSPASTAIQVTSEPPFPPSRITCQVVHTTLCTFRAFFSHLLSVQLHLQQDGLHQHRPSTT